MAEELQTAETSTDLVQEEVAVSSESDAEFEDTTEAENAAADQGESNDGQGKSSEGKAGGQTKEERAKYARERRERETQAKIQQERVQATIDALGGVNPYTGESMTDAEDVEEWRRMREIEKDGGDPISDYSKYQKKQAREAAENAKRERESKEWFDNDKKAFAQKFPDVRLEEIIKDKGFQTFTRGRVGSIPLADMYAEYQTLISHIQESANQKAAQALANAKASPGPLSTGGDQKSNFYTYEQVKKMSHDERIKHMDAILESQKKWGK